MTYNASTATDYIDLLNQTIEVLSSDHVDTVDVITAAGINYVVGEILNLDGSGTFTHAAQLEVTAVSGGNITGVRIYRGGAYTADPDLTAHATVSTGFTFDGTATTPGTGATFDMSMAPTGWTELTRQSEAVAGAPTITNGGTGYTNGSSDVLTVIGGVLALGGSAATYTATVAGGIVTSAALLTAGDYEVFPASPVQTSVSAGLGIDCTLTFASQETTGDTIVVLQGTASGTDPLIGIKTYSSETDESAANTVHNWAMFGMSAWSPLSALHQQANISPGFNVAADGTITTSTSGDGSFVPLKEAADAGPNMEWWMSATGRRVVLIVKVSDGVNTHYAQTSFGFYNQFGTTTEFSFPAYVAGASDRKRVWFNDTASLFGGLTDVIYRNNGPFFTWTTEGTWLFGWAGFINSNTDLVPDYGNNATPIVKVWPLGQLPINTGDASDQIWATAPAAGFDNADLTLSSGAVQIRRTPDTGGDLFPLFPLTVAQSLAGTNTYRVFGEVDGVFWFHQAGSGIGSEDRFTQGTDRFTVFPNGTRTEPFSFLALRED